ncbi:MAG: SUMF1/EgtB/PvdO family nonheme iron enzyme, partial [Polyangiales bacterium]
MSPVRPLSALLVASLGAFVFLAPIADVEAGMRCGVGKPNHDTGMCDCPGGYRSVGTAGNSECELVAKPKPPTTTTSAATTSSASKGASDIGASVTIKGGVFRMGSDDTALAHAGPAHVVTMGDVEIDKYEVTVDEYKKCIDAGICGAPPDKMPTMLHAERCNWGSGRGNHPMNCVTWQESVNYCAFKGKRLPSEAEWEYAARGGVATHKYPWGSADPTCTLANYSANPDSPVAGCGDGTSAVGSHPSGATSQGVHDLAGNVEEWVGDWFAGYTATPTSSPGGPASGTQRVAKGSSWDLDKVPEMDVARREGMDPSHRANWLGFRCVKSSKAPETSATLYTPIVPPAPPTVATAKTITPDPKSTVSETPKPATTFDPKSVTASAPAPGDLGAMVHIAS